MRWNYTKTLVLLAFAGGLVRVLLHLVLGEPVAKSGGALGQWLAMTLIAFPIGTVMDLTSAGLARLRGAIGRQAG